MTKRARHSKLAVTKPAASPGKAHQRVFRILLGLVPILLLALAEAGLRLLGAFAPEPFVLETVRAGKSCYQLNQWVAKRYFDPARVTVPGMQPDLFVKHKGPEVFRIFCVGGSTTAGFPFDCNVPFPVQLRYLLAQTYPQRRFEVLNAGISAVNSFTVVDLLPEMLALQPDMIIIYMGHNEFYGAYGSASTISLGQNGRLIRTYLKLHKLHVVQMLRRLISWLRPAAEQNARPPSLMANVIGDQAIVFGSPKYRRTLANFQDNLALILRECARRGVPVLIGTLFSNLRDLPPFASEQPALPADARARYQQALARGDSLLQQRRFAESESAYRTAWLEDSSAAVLWYKRGLASAGLGDSTAALHFFTGAKDRDLIRFRASEEVNQIIAALARKYRAHCVDLRSRLAQRSPQGLLGNNLLVDHLHPNPPGYYLMATGFYEAIRAGGWLTDPVPQFQPADQPYYVTDLDWDIGLMKILEMTHRWPFPEKPVSFHDYRPYGDPATLPIVRDYLLRDNVWSRAHYRMAEVYWQRGNFARARREYLAVSVFAPEDPYPYQQVARTYEQEGAWDMREFYLRKTLPYSDHKGMLLYQIAIAQWRQQKLAAACETMRAALEQADLTHQERQNAKFYLAGFHADAGDPARAAELLTGLLREDPTFQPARVFLQRLRPPAQ
ncbi:MAG: GDSL-type esterase/lipase family protein [candidate division KSB1 bacterium]|nr:GDSL-type esterase/lipase family protein [candidate division KSB1 bacterium]MDZ7276264.1 GDSL-type esterase/lipase family protein [candidate division KSB1 bacterium]MDZ7287930.1 GDSL-type esterase/lipase family protein [candidate division KSB1 bacterium]MDZ7300057.1 GDSL-type esterase/lipase family protein [candidate division KSB1 bacterium]MDZ7307299.1 GDSL-type esterase/lipase family protein [candidate division KSB1 bacterium]